ncbi:MAG: helix-turn-helix domain-containing protein [Planctomycetota bacterium]
MTVCIHCCGYAKWPRVWRWDCYRSGKTAWNDHDLWCIHQGGGVLHCSEGQFQLQVGDVFLFHPDDHYIADADPANPGRLFYIHFDWVDACGLPRYQVLTPRLHRRMDDFALFSSLLWRVVRAFNQQRDQRIAALWLQVALNEIEGQDAMSAATGQSDTAGHLRASIERIARDPGQYANAAAIAAECHCSSRHLTRLFRDLMGRTPQDYLLEQRLARAGELLRATDLPIKAIADQVGFRDVSYFVRRFRLAHGQTPGTYRRKGASFPAKTAG